MAIKPGIRTTEFWVSVLTSIGALAFAAADKVPPRYAALVALVSSAAYALARGLAKRPVVVHPVIPTQTVSAGQNIPPVTTR